MTVNKIHTRAMRAKLGAQNEPYWHTISKGRAIGYRKTRTGGAWIARRVKRQRRLGGETVTYHEALRLAMEWFARMDRGADKRCTIKQAIDERAARMCAEKGEKASRRYALSMRRHVPESTQMIEIDRLKQGDIASWLYELVVPKTHDRKPVSPATANILLNNLRAALNYAWNMGYVSGDKVWSRVEAYKGVAKKRELYMTTSQVRTMLLHAQPEFRRFCKVALLTGARPGEVANIKVQDYIKEHGTLMLNGKTGARTIRLSDEAIALLRSYAMIRPSQELLLKTRTGKKWTARTWGMEIRRIRRDGELPMEFVAYSIRHYYISRALLAGVSLQMIEKNCGTSTEMIRKYYGKFIDTDRVEMLNRVDVMPRSKAAL